MSKIPDNITQVAFGKSDEAPLTSVEQDICDEWTSGKATEYMMVEAEDPRLLEYAGMYNKLEAKKDEIWESIQATYAITMPNQEAPVVQLPSRKTGNRTWLLAAAILTGSIIGVYALYQFINNSKNTEPATNTITDVQKPIEPGKERAVLTLDDNKQIDLDTLPAGIVAYQDNMEISKQKDNQLVYKVAGNIKAGTKIANNKLTTPYGGEYKITLADGSKVWLNAGSSLRYPTAFNGNDRKVEISGEGYFEVAEDKTKPFRVFTHQGTEVKVLGTKFNVKAYDSDNQVTTTLVNGSVAVQHGSTLKNIKPNQQAVVAGDSIRIKTKSKEEMARVLAWKQGLINLEGESVQSILQQIQRWYNVETKIETGTPETTLTGTVEKTTPLAQVLELLNTTNVSVLFTLQGHTVVAEEKKSN